MADCLPYGSYLRSGRAFGAESLEEEISHLSSLSALCQQLRQSASLEESRGNFQVAAELRLDFGELAEEIELALRHQASNALLNSAGMLAAAGAVGSWLGLAGPAPRGDPGTVLAALQTQKDAFKWASRELRSDRETVLLATRLSSISYLYAHPRLHGDRELLLAAVSGSSEDNFVFFSLAPAHRADREIVLAALHRQRSECRHHLPNFLAKVRGPILQDEEVVLLALQADTAQCAFSWADPVLRSSKEFVLRCLRTVPKHQQFDCYMQATAELKNSISWKQMRSAAYSGLALKGEQAPVLSVSLGRGSEDIIIASFSLLSGLTFDLHFTAPYDDIGVEEASALVHIPAKRRRIGEAPPTSPPPSPAATRKNPEAKAKASPATAFAKAAAASATAQTTTAPATATAQPAAQQLGSTQIALTTLAASAAMLGKVDQPCVADLSIGGLVELTKRAGLPGAHAAAPTTVFLSIATSQINSENGDFLDFFVPTPFDWARPLYEFLPAKTGRSGSPESV